MIKDLKFLIAFFIGLSVGQTCYAQKKEVDSVIALLKTNKQDTLKLRHLYFLTDKLEVLGKYDEGIEYGKRGLALSNLLQKQLDPSTQKKRLTRLKSVTADIYTNLGLIYANKGDSEEALKYHKRSLAISIKIKSKEGMSIAYNNLGLAYYNIGNYSESLTNHLRSLRLREILGDKNGMAASYNNIGILYSSKENYTEAIKNFKLTIAIRSMLLDERGNASSYCNIGNLYETLGNYDEALKNHYACLKICVQNDIKFGIALSYNNIGNVISNQSKHESDPVKKKTLSDTALSFYFKTTKMYEELGDEDGLASSYYNTGNLLLKRNDLKKAESYLKRSIELCLKLNYKECLKEAYKAMMGLDSTRGNYAGAFENLKLFRSYNDSIHNEESGKKSLQAQMTYDFEKKEAIAMAEHKKELEHQKLITDAKDRKQALITYSITGGLVLVLLSALFVFRTLKTTRKQKDIIQFQKAEVELQKKIAEEKQKEVIDSIVYAKRIQKALLPSEKYFERTYKRLTRQL